MHKYKTTDRITVDIDKEKYPILTFTRALIVLNKSRKIRDWNRIEVFESASRKGYHIYIFLNHSIKYETQFKYRKMLGDCPVRLMLSKRDLKKGFNPDVMFTHKKIKGEWKEERLIFKVERVE